MFKRNRIFFRKDFNVSDVLYFKDVRWQYLGSASFCIGDFSWMKFWITPQTISGAMGQNPKE